MKVKCHVLEKDVTVTFTPTEVNELICICDASKMLHEQMMKGLARNTEAWNKYKRLVERDKRIQKKFSDILASSPLKEIEI